MLISNVIFGVAIGLASLVTAIPLSEDGLELLNLNLTNRLMPDSAGASGYDPSFKWHDYSMVQVWMGKAKVSVGNLVGPKLYEKVYELLDRGCPDNGWHSCHDVKNAQFQSRCMVNWPGLIEPCWTDFFQVTGHWENNAMRELLISAVAGALEAVTLRDVHGNTNCFDMAGQKGCNVGDVVRVNYATSLDHSDQGGENFMHVALWNSKTGYGNWDCCEGDKRALMDKAIDGNADKIVALYPQYWGEKFTRDSRCIINEWAVCP